MLARILSGAVHGVDAYIVRVEVDFARGMPTFATVGLAQGAVKESKERVTAAVQNSGFDWPLGRITVNLAPADVRKEGSAFDLPMAIAILIASGYVHRRRGERVGFIGELGLDGRLRPVRGVLSIAMAMRAKGVATLVVPVSNAPEAALVDGLDVRGADTLHRVIEFVAGGDTLVREDADPSLLLGTAPDGAPDLADVKGQRHARRAIEIAAAGAHNVLLVGSPGSGKTMLARRMPGILPPLTMREALETTRIHSVAGLLPPGAAIVTERPFRSPHHTVSDAGLIGGGTTPRPGEISMAHNGVLFLDELTEYRRNVLESLRQPLEDFEVTVARSSMSVTYPARAMVVAAMNPCPCGYLGDIRRACTCPSPIIERYLARISGPLLDRIDLHVEVPAVEYGELSAVADGEDSCTVRARVARARERQVRRYEAIGRSANAHLHPREIREHCRLSADAEVLLKNAITRLGLSARAYHRVLKVARTIADLDGREGIGSGDVAEAVQYRALDRTNGFSTRTYA